MGCLLCKQVKINEETKKIFQSKLIPSDEFLCSNCSELIPEILSIHFDNMKIDFECKKCSKIKENYENYQLKLDYHNYFYTPCYYCKQTSQNNEDFFFIVMIVEKSFVQKKNAKKSMKKTMKKKMEKNLEKKMVKNQKK